MHPRLGVCSVGRFAENLAHSSKCPQLPHAGGRGRKPENACGVAVRPATSAGGRDAEWRDIFTGAIDYRMKTEVLPRVFTGLSTIRLPPAWRMMTAIGRPPALRSSLLNTGMRKS